MMKRSRLLLALLLLILLLPSGLAMAEGRYDRIIREGETVEGSVTVIDDDLRVEAGGTVDGDVTVFGGDAHVAGTITGDAAVFDGDVILSGTIEGDLVLFGGDLQIEEGAQVDGSCFTMGGDVVDSSATVSCASFGSRFGSSSVLEAMPPLPAVPESPSPPEFEVRGPSFFSRVGHFFLDVSQVVGRSILLGILALIVTAVFPRQLQQVSDAIRRKPAASGAVGVLTAVAGPSLIVLLLVVLAITCVGLLLYPAVFLLALALFAAALLGWIAVGDVLGRMLLRSLSVKSASLPLTAALGTTVLTLLFGGLGLLPFVWGESLVIILLVSVGLGAAALTQFGTKPYPPTRALPENPDKVSAAIKTVPPEEGDEA